MTFPSAIAILQSCNYSRMYQKSSTKPSTMLIVIVIARRRGQHSAVEGDREHNGDQAGATEEVMRRRADELHDEQADDRSSAPQAYAD